jgi:uncharacterized protein (DUF488 family)
MTTLSLFTIGFTQKSAETFFTKLQSAGVKRILDARLNNVSQLAGFAKREDLRFFLKRLCHIDYLHLPNLAPTQEILDTFKKEKGGWERYEKEFLALLKARRIEDRIAVETLEGGCLLCSEASPHHCHRRLVAEYLQDKRGAIEIIHIL